MNFKNILLESPPSLRGRAEMEEVDKGVRGGLGESKTQRTHYTCMKLW